VTGVSSADTSSQPTAYTEAERQQMLQQQQLAIQQQQLLLRSTVPLQSLCVMWWNLLQVDGIEWKYFGEFCKL